MTVIKRYAIGERVKQWPARSWNEIADRVEQPGFNPLEPDSNDTGGIIPVRNSSTSNIPKGGVMQPTGSMLSIEGQADHVANVGPLLLVDVPDLNTGGESIYMIATQPISAGATGGGLLMGPVWARVNIRDFSDKYAQAIDGDATKLESTASGSRARIIAKESGSGEKWALILLAPYRLRIRKGIVNNTDGQTEIAAGGSGTVDVYQNGSAVGEENKWWLDWLYGNNPATRDILTDQKAIAADFEDENIFTIFAADCPPMASPAPPGHAEGINLTTESAGTSQVTAFQFAFNSNQITTATATDNATKLPDSSDVDQGDYCHVRNDDTSGSDSIQVFPVSGGEINNLGTDTADTIAAGAGKIYTLVRSGTDHWISS